MCRLGFSPRKAELVLYVLTEEPAQQAQLARLGKHRNGKSCLYIKKLADVDEGGARGADGGRARLHEREVSGRGVISAPDLGDARDDREHRHGGGRAAAPMSGKPPDSSRGLHVTATK